MSQTKKRAPQKKGKTNFSWGWVSRQKSFPKISLVLQQAVGITVGITSVGITGVGRIYPFISFRTWKESDLGLKRRGKKVKSVLYLYFSVRIRWISRRFLSQTPLGIRTRGMSALIFHLGSRSRRLIDASGTRHLNSNAENQIGASPRNGRTEPWL